MRRPLIHLALVLACVFSARAVEPSQRVSVGPPPDWVLVDPLPADTELPSTNLADGICYVLADDQIRVTDKGEEAYSRSVEKVVNVAGIEDASELRVTYDPAYQDLVLHAARVLRGTNVVDQLSPARIKVIEREDNLEYKMLDGRLSALLFLDDVRVGDMIEFAYTVTGSNPIFGGRHMDDFLLQWEVPVAKFRHLILMPKDRPLAVRLFKSDFAPREFVTNGFSAYLWETNDISALTPDGDEPDWYETHAYAQVSEYTNWEDVARWAAPLYKPTKDLSPAMQQFVDQARREHTNTAERVLAAVQFVQDHVRYLGLELGPSSYEPADPAVVFERRFGDCKDKSRLLCTLARALGAEARPVLVDSERGAALTEQLPAPTTFDHCIARLNVDGSTYYVDPTFDHERGPLDRLYTPPYRHGLVIDTLTTNLATIPVVDPNTPQLSEVSLFDIKDYSNAVTMHVTTVYRGAEADERRRTFSTQTAQELHKSYLNYYAHDYPEIHSTVPITITDDETNDVITVTEEYAISNFWTEASDGGLEQSFHPSLISQKLYWPDTALRVSPLWVEYPLNMEQRYEVDLPESGWAITNITMAVTNSALRFDYTVRYVKRHVSIDYHLRARADHVDVPRVAPYLRDLDRIDDALGYQLSIADEDEAGGDDAHPASQVNWIIVVIALMSAPVLVALCILVYLYAASAPPQPPPLAHDPLAGIGGWLVLVAIGVFASPLAIAFQMWTTLPSYGMDTWVKLTTPGSTVYHVLWAPALILELVGNLAIISFSVLIAVLFVQRRSRFPRIYMVFLAATVLIRLADHLVPFIIDRSLIESKDTAELVRGVFVSMMWILYFARSRRVRATFTR